MRLAASIVKAPQAAMQTIDTEISALILRNS